VTPPDAHVYEIEPEPDPAERAAIVSALERISGELGEAAETPWTAAARREAVDDRHC
jgi:hypothetical protein